MSLRDGKTFTARTMDLAPGGISILAPLDVRAGTTCMLRFEVPKEGGRTQPAAAVAKVIYSALHGTEGFWIGLQFLEFDKNLSDVIRRHLK